MKRYIYNFEGINRVMAHNITHSGFISDKKYTKHTKYLAAETENYRQLWKSCKGLFTPNLGHYTNDIATPASILFADFCRTRFSQELLPVRFLDIGCGNARNSIPFAKLGYSCVGIDIAPEAVEIAKLNAQRNSVLLELFTGDVLSPTLLLGS